ncbi:TetR/AcrR family transcriptional regulator [Clostridium lacusfryxellense]|uniref:TetR/AcrR family transcriptional regulator n=1 Tax=Clostridium lacusfryxellense TaxID=205328 RepID=UPI001C0BCDD9|nr:TetR/AcrR family transcriptional regulator [Clostridium lacusfryxellense]MBU3113668.1 TetR/AcrR family transcriptional regulator [Clostridium lacusfryxellense]
MNKQPEVTAQTKQNLIDAFWSLYFEKRIAKITVKEIAQRAGYNRGTFYEYFTDIYDVLDQIEQSLVPNLDELPPTAKLDNNMDMPLNMFIKLYEQNYKYYSVLFGDNGDPAFASKIKSSIKPLIMKTISGKVDRSDIELDFILEYILSAMIGILSYWFRVNKILPAEDLIELMYELMDNEVMNKLT